MKAEKLYLSIAEVATALGLARITVYRWTETGRMPSVKLGSRRLVPIEGLAAFVAAGTK